MKHPKKIINDSFSVDDNYVQEWQFRLTDDEYDKIVDLVLQIVGLERNQVTKIVLSADVSNIVKLGVVSESCKWVVFMREDNEEGVS